MYAEKWMKTESDKHGIFHSFIEEYSFTHRVRNILSTDTRRWHCEPDVATRELSETGFEDFNPQKFKDLNLTFALAVRGSSTRTDRLKRILDFNFYCLFQNPTILLYLPSNVMLYVVSIMFGNFFLWRLRRRRTSPWNMWYQRHGL